MASLQILSELHAGQKKSIAVLAASLRPLRHGLGRKKEKNDWMTTATGVGTATKICFKALVHRS
jgi:hypothetical protein